MRSGTCLLLLPYNSIQQPSIIDQASTAAGKSEIK